MRASTSSRSDRSVRRGFARALPGHFLAAAFALLASPAWATLAELQDITALAAGGLHTCALTAAGGVTCWGDNSSGQLGDGTRFSRTLPVDVIGLGSPAVALSAGATHSCAVLAGGGVKCWGGNRYSQIGAAGLPEAWYPTPVTALGLESGIVSVAAGHYHTCATTTAGAVKCWGINVDGLIGGAPDVPSLTGGVTALAASGAFVAISPRFITHYPITCALQGGGVLCWGYNRAGELGSGLPPVDSAVPLPVSGLSAGVQSIAYGGKTGCALLATGGVKCWGDLYGPVPVDVAGATGGVASISVGWYHRCLVTTGGGAQCWGNNDVWGQSGVASPPGPNTPTDVAGLASGVAAVAGGERHSCGLLATGRVRCWGDNNFNQVGDGGVAALNVPPSPVMTGTLPHLANISTRAQVLTGDDVTIAGFIVQGTGPKTVVVRARGPSLVAAGIANPLVNPYLQLFAGPTLLGANDNWLESPDAGAITAAGFAPADTLESAILVTLDPGAYTAIVSGVGGLTGVAIVEVFELDNPQVPLANISTRSRVLSGDNVMIAGFVIQGDSPQEVVIRARGPSLASEGIADPLADPVLQLFAGQSLVAANDNWGDLGAAAFTLSARGMAPWNNLESALLITLPPGAYTAIVSGAGAAYGVGIVEVFIQ